MRSWWLAVLLLSCTGAQTKVSAPTRPLDAQDVWLSHPTVMEGGPLLFADEVAPVADAIAEFLGAHPDEGLRPIANDAVRATWKGARVGKLTGVAQVCPVPLPPASLSEVVYANASRGDTEIDCAESACALTLVIERTNVPDDTDSDARELARFVAELPRDPKQWAATIAKHGLKRVPRPKREDVFGILGALGAMPDAPVHVAFVRREGTWSEPLDDRTIAPQASRFVACERDARPWRDWWMEPYLVEIDASGKLLRCEAPDPDHLPKPSFSCGCEALRAVDFGPGSAGRRASFEVTVVQPTPAGVANRSAYVKDTKASDRSAALGGAFFDQARATQCLSSVPPPLELVVPVHLEVRADGRAEKVTVAWPALDATAKGCLEAALRDVQLDCPLSGHASVDTKLVVSVKK